MSTITNTHKVNIAGIGWRRVTAYNGAAGTVTVVGGQTYPLRRIMQIAKKPRRYRKNPAPV